MNIVRLKFRWKASDIVAEHILTDILFILGLLVLFFTITTRGLAALPKLQQKSILMLTPSNGAMNVTTTELIMIHYWKDASFDTSGEMTIFLSNGQVFEKIPFDSEQVVDLSASRIIIDPQNDFQLGESYSIQFRANDSPQSASIRNSEDWQFRVGTELIEEIIHSSIMKKDFRLLIMLPDDYHTDTNKKYPAIYVTDGGLFNYNQYAHIADAIASKDIPKVIVVGIGYPRKYGIKHIREFRVKDLTQKSDQFRKFLEQEIIPYIDRTYRSDPSNRTLMGNSAGGFFTASTFIEYRPNRVNTFKNYIVVAQLYDFLEQEEQLAKTIDDLPVNLYLSIGSEDKPEGIEAFHSLVNRLKSRNYQSFRFEHRIIEGAPHGEVSAVPSFREGLTLFLGDVANKP